MDKIDTLLQTALSGVQTGQRRLQEAAHSVATAPADASLEPTELTEPLVRMLEAQRAIEASAVVMRRADDMLGTLLEALRS
jgi:flagellar hook protein FlgE